ncbi:unnamed protein product [Spirodela intermedia]|uniref:Uncharacterized protein n=1 Tax=Spirodela intermedia TaxID=51605 RepID=A0ABN7EAD9_SPIIN|nr:unnamed protein product [Spirodela intermedia]
MRRQCTRILSVQEDSRVVDQWNGSSSRLRWLSPGGAEKWRLCGSLAALDGGGHMLGSFILKSTQQEEALHRI